MQRCAILKGRLTRRAALASSLAALALSRTSEAETGRGSWSIATPLPYAVQEIYPVAFHGRIILAGGIVDDRRTGIAASARTVNYVPEEGAWIEGPDLPIALHHPGLVALSDRVLAIGGFAADEGGFWQMQRSVFSLDRDLTGWAEKTPLPAPRAEFVAASIDGQVIIVGGRTPRGSGNSAYGHHVDVDETLVFDPVSQQWRYARPAPTARNSAAGAVLGNRLHIVGGRISGSGGIRNLDVHEAYDPALDQWTVLAPMPQAQGGLAASTIGNRLYAFGGEFFGARSGVYEEAWAYDPTSDRWEAAPSLPVPRHGLGAVALSDGIHVIGGAAQAGADGRSNLHDVFRPD
jgi:N-acetylneuraminic acid mutarotase